MGVRILVGDALGMLKTLADESVHCVVSSPPYYSLRDYGVAGQIGLEPSPNEYITALVAVFREVKRVLRSDGTLWLNIGDSYASGGRATYRSGASDNKGQLVQNDLPRPVDAPGIKPKDMLGIPWMLAFALRADGWWLRQDIIWSKPNPMPESVTDRCTKAHEYLFLMTKSEQYFYDAVAVQEPSITGDPRRPYTSEGAWQMDGRPAEQRHGGKPRTAGNKSHKYVTAYEGSDSEEHRTKAGLMKIADVPWDSRNRRSVWTIATSPYPEAHFATFPPDLVEPCILAGTSEYGVCGKCGGPWERVVEKQFTPQQDVSEERGIRCAEGQKPMDATSGWPGVPRGTTVGKTLGWQPTCSCGPDAGIRQAVVLDPFAGAFTTCLVADRLKRDAVGIELSPTYAEMGRKRLIADAGMFANIVLD